MGKNPKYIVSISNIKTWSYTQVVIDLRNDQWMIWVHFRCISMNLMQPEYNDVVVTFLGT